MISSYFKQKTQELLAKYDTSKIQRASKNLGDNREIFIRDFLEKVLPHRLRVVSGELFDQEMLQSGQLDTIIVKDDCPSLDFGGENSFYVGGTFSAIEVKSQLTTGAKGTLHQALVSLGKVAKLNYPPAQILIGKMSSVPLPLKVIFSYKSSSSLDTIDSYIKKEKLESNYDLICVLDKGVIIGPQLLSGFWDQFVINQSNIGSVLSNVMMSKSISLGLLYYYLVEYGSTFLIGSSSLDPLFKDLASWE